MKLTLKVNTNLPEFTKITSFDHERVVIQVNTKLIAKIQSETGKDGGLLLAYEVLSKIFKELHEAFSIVDFERMEEFIEQQEEVEEYDNILSIINKCSSPNIAFNRFVGYIVDGYHPSKAIKQALK